MKVDQILSVNENIRENTNEIFDSRFIENRKEMWAKENQTLQYLIKLPSNFQPENLSKVASYKKIEKQFKNHKPEEDERNLSSFSSSKNIFTLEEMKSKE